MIDTLFQENRFCELFIKTFFNAIDDNNLEPKSKKFPPAISTGQFNE